MSYKPSAEIRNEAVEIIEIYWRQHCKTRSLCRIPNATAHQTAAVTPHCPSVAPNRRDCSSRLDTLLVSRYSIQMEIIEDVLREYRGDDDLCRLKPEYGGPHKFTDYQKVLAELSEIKRQPNLIQHARLKPTHTWDYFDDLSDVFGQGIVAILAYMNLVPILPITRTWMAFQHQAAGYACRQIVVIGTVLEPKPKIKKAFTEIAKKNCYALGGWFEGPDSDPKTTARYIDDIENLGLSCSDGARHELCESIYPVDATRRALKTCFEDIEDLIYLTEDERAKPLVLFLSSNSD